MINVVNMDNKFMSITSAFDFTWFDFENTSYINNISNF